jgi:hypothetical protein
MDSRTPTMEEKQLEGYTNQIVENNLSKVKIIHNSKSTTWEISVKHEDPYKASEVAQIINHSLEVIYGNK